MIITPAWFWGSFLILFGVSILLKELFNISLPIVKLFLALFLILLGINMLVNPSFISQSFICKIV
jgi:LiaF transmembrane domain